MTELIKSGIYIQKITTDSRDNNTFWVVSGYKLGRYVKNVGDWGYATWDGATRDPQEAMNWCGYLLDSAYNLLPEDMKARYNNKIVTVNGLTVYSYPYCGVTPCETRYALGLNPDEVYEPTSPDPCDDITYEPETDPIPDPNHDLYYGDINDDGTIGQMDALLMGKYVVYGADTYPLTEDQLSRADVDADGDVDYDDVLLITRHVRGEIDAFPASVQPEPDPEPEQDSSTMMYMAIAGALIAFYMYMRG